jgi:hypothetical protein
VPQKIASRRLSDRAPCVTASHAGVRIVSRAETNAPADGCAKFDEIVREAQRRAPIEGFDFLPHPYKSGPERARKSRPITLERKNSPTSTAGRSHWKKGML